MKNEQKSDNYEHTTNRFQSDGYVATDDNDEGCCSVDRLQSNGCVATEGMPKVVANGRTHLTSQATSAQ